MASLFHKERTPSPSSDSGRSLPPEMRQLIVDLKAEHPDFRPHEIATICFLRFERRSGDLATLLSARGLDLAERV